MICSLTYIRFTYSQDVVGREEISEIYSELGIFPIDERKTWGSNHFRSCFCSVAASLVAQPGERFVYSVSIDVLGRVLEIAEEKNLSEVIEKVLRPLEMESTFFFMYQMVSVIGLLRCFDLGSLRT